MSAGRSCRWRRGGVALALCLLVIAPRAAAAEATTVRYYEIRKEQTNLRQSDFKSVPSCELVYPTLDRSTFYVYINQPADMMAYTGPDQPYGDRWPQFGKVAALWFCDKGEVEEKKLEVKDRREMSGFERDFAWAVGSFMGLLGTVALWIIWLASSLLVPLLSVGSFITNPMVTSGWPFVQGIANLGFMLALLFIAFATTLRLESGNVRRMLPRLLIAALLINFSLVITGLLIDVSRLVMAGLIAVFNTGGLDNLGFGLLKSSRLIGINYTFQTFQQLPYVAFTGSTDSWQAVASVMQATVLMWGLAAGLIILTAGLFVRYIMLVLLLIVSPLAFLAVALPNAGHLAQKWWATFIKYVLYGPIAAFVLVLTVAASQGLADTVKVEEQGLLPSFLNLFLVIAMMIAAATAGSKLGIMGAGATLNFMKQAPGFIRRHPRTAGAIVGGLATGGVGGILAGVAAGKLGQMGVRNVRSLADESTKPFRKKWKIGKYSKYDDQGKLKRGQKNWGQYIGQTVDPDIRAARRATSHGDGAVQPEKLVKADVVLSLNKTVISDILAHGSKAQKLALVQNVEFVDDIMTNTQKADALRDPDTQAQMLRTLREIANRASRPK